MELPDAEEAPRHIPDKAEQLKGQAWWQADDCRREKMLRLLWEDQGIITQKIAERIGDGCTKNMVISKAHRLGLEPRVEPKPKPPPRGTALMDLKGGECAWPIGNPGDPDFHFCASRPLVPGKPYCEHHCAVAYIRTGPQRQWTEEQRQAARLRMMETNKRHGITTPWRKGDPES